ncbi:hypothetical protein C5E41_26145 [Nocardia nova]|nr:hypothetical protein C5E41_26145 [Nocardia nova]
MYLPAKARRAGSRRSRAARTSACTTLPSSNGAADSATASSASQPEARVPAGGAVEHRLVGQPRIQRGPHIGGIAADHRQCADAAQFGPDRGQRTAAQQGVDPDPGRARRGGEGRGHLRFQLDPLGSGEVKADITTEQREGKVALTRMLLPDRDIEDIEDDDGGPIGVLLWTLLDGLLVQRLLDPKSAPSAEQLVAGLRTLAPML